MYAFLGARKAYMSFNALLQCQRKKSNFGLDNSETEPELFEGFLRIKFLMGQCFPNPYLIQWEIQESS